MITTNGNLHIRINLFNLVNYTVDHINYPLHLHN